MKAVSLFSGVGGIELGFDRTGIETVLQAESDPLCLSVLARWWPSVTRVDDVRKVDKATWQRRCGDLDRDGRSANGQRLGNEARSAISTDIGSAISQRGSTNGCGVSDAAYPRSEFGGGWQAGARLSGDIDLVYGGFPCQDLSVAGKRAGLSGERSGLFFEFARVVRELRPRWFTFENVPGLLSSAAGADFGTILGTMVGLGYGVAWRILDARWFGVPQRRRRVFVVGCLGDARRAAQVLAVCESCGGHPAKGRAARQESATPADGSVAFTLPAEHRGIGNGWNSNYVASLNNGQGEPNAIEDGTASALQADAHNYVAATQSGSGHPGSNMPGRHHEDDENLLVARSQTSRNQRIDAESENFLSSNAGVRRLTPLECERLMGWPDNHTWLTCDGKEIVDSHRYRMCGNGVVATVAEWLGHRLVAVDKAAQQ